jgi:hypothetical protein
MKKNILLLSVLLVFCISTHAQRMADIRVAYIKARNGSVAIPNQPIDLSLNIYNNDTLQLKSDDTLAFYEIFDADTSYFNINGKFQDHFDITGINLNPGDSFIFKYATVFATTDLNKEHDICVVILPKNRQKPVQDQALANNNICAHILVRKTLELAANTENTVRIEVFPNPCRDFISVRSSKTIQSIMVYDLFGREVRELRLDDLTLIPLSLPSPGAYIVKFITATAVLAKTIIAE